MASGTITVTIDTGEWSYPDASGVTHAVTNAETFTLASTDTSATDVQHILTASGTLATDDGYVITIDPSVIYAGTSSAEQNFAGVLGDTANDGVTTYGNIGEMVCRCSASAEVPQHWKIKSIVWDDVDNPTTLTLECESKGKYFKLDGVTASFA